jgi:LPXTG-motif cell wall-anchored protein
MKSRNHRLLSGVIVASFCLSLFGVIAPVSVSPASAARLKAVKYGVCHRTNAIKNPYRFITVAWSSVDPNGNGHDNPSHDGPVFNIADPAASHGTTPRDSGLGAEAGGSNNRWGDIFVASRLSGNGNNFNSNNWGTDAQPNVAGRSIFNGATFTYNGVTKAACRQMSVVEYIASEREENPNKAMSDIMAELDDMEAAEDVAVKQSLGGSFTSWFASCNRATTDCENTTIISAQIAAESPSVTTQPPTSISSGTSTNTETATLNGTISPLGISMIWYFEFDDDADFTTGGGDVTEVIEVPGTPGTSSSPTTVNVTFNATGLNSTKTYYYRTVGVATTGTGDELVETYLYGVTKQFTYGAPAAPTITGITCGSQSLSVAFTAGSANGGTITNYEYSTDGGSTFTAVSPSATTSPIAISGLVNGTNYTVVLRAVTSTKTGVDSTVVTGTPCGTPGSTTTAATNVQPTTATLNGHLTGNGNALASISFTWGTSSTLASGNTITGANTTSLASSAIEYPVLANITGLTGGTTYYFEVSGTYANGASTTSGGILSFVTPANVAQPTTTTNAATSVEETTATINGVGTSNGASSTLTFTWGTSPTLASGNTTVAPSQSPLAPSAVNTPAFVNLTGLTGGMTYYFRITITNTNGTVNGSILQFVTTAPTTTTSTVPPTSTIPPSTTVPAVTVNDAELGRVIGTAWFDINQNNKKDANEPLLAGVDVEVRPRSVSSQSLRGVRASALTVKTTSTGSFDFSNLAPGVYEIISALPGDYGIEQSWDSSGNADWTVTVTVLANKTSRGDFAAIGTVAASGCVAGSTANSTLGANWAGFDGVLGTSDDALFGTDLGADCEFDLTGLPTGSYKVEAKNSSGKVFASSALRLSNKGSVFKSGAISMTIRIVRVLPATGAQSMKDWLAVAMVLMAGGSGVSMTNRRRRRA